MTTKADVLLAESKARVVNVGELVKRIREALDAARRLGVLSSTMIREGDDGPMIVKLGAHPIIVREVGAEQFRAWAEEAGIPWKDGYEERVVEVWASDERVDRDGDIVEQSWRFDNFAKNPLVLWGHEWGAPPIGNAIQWSVEDRKEDDYDGPALRLTELFAPEEASAQAESVLRLAKAGFLRSGSVGFYPGQVVAAESDEAREELGLPEGGFLLRENELIEHSHCSVPCNPGALNILAAAKAAGGLAPTDVATIRELARQDALIVGREDVWSRMDSVLRRVWRELYPDVAVEDHKSIAQPVEADSAVERKDGGGCWEDVDAGRLGEPAKDEPTGDEPAGDEPTGDESAGETAATLEEVASDLSSTMEAVTNLVADVGNLKQDVADLKSDAEGDRREAEQAATSVVSTIIGELRENAGKALAKSRGDS